MWSGSTQWPTFHCPVLQLLCKPKWLPGFTQHASLWVKSQYRYRRVATKSPQQLHLWFPRAAVKTKPTLFCFHSSIFHLLKSSRWLWAGGVGYTHDWPPTNCRACEETHSHYDGQLNEDKSDFGNVGGSRSTQAQEIQPSGKQENWSWDEYAEPQNCEADMLSTSTPCCPPLPISSHTKCDIFR